MDLKEAISEAQAWIDSYKCDSSPMGRRTNAAAGQLIAAAKETLARREAEPKRVTMEEMEARFRAVSGPDNVVLDCGCRVRSCDHARLVNLAAADLVRKVAEFKKKWEEADPLTKSTDPIVWYFVDSLP